MPRLRHNLESETRTNQEAVKILKRLTRRIEAVVSVPGIDFSVESINVLNGDQCEGFCVTSSDSDVAAIIVINGEGSFTPRQQIVRLISNLDIVEPWIRCTSIQIVTPCRIR